MPYTANISRTSPGCFIFLIDQSRSMKEDFAGQQNRSKMDGAAEAVNKAIDNIAQRCSQGNEIRRYFDIAILGYTTDQFGRARIKSELPDTTPERPFLSIEKTVENAILIDAEEMVEDVDGNQVLTVKKRPTWLKPQGRYGTPMKSALNSISRAVEIWAGEHPESYPPIVIHISDGNSTDGDPEETARKLAATGTDDGNTLLFNIHVSATREIPTTFPGRLEQLPAENKYAATMFSISSKMPPTAARVAATMDIEIEPDSRGYVLNADFNTLVQFLDIGTRATPDLH